MATTTTQSGEQVQGIPEEYRPQVDKLIGNLAGTYDSGGLQHVEGFSGEQLDAFGRKKQLGAQGGAYDSIAGDSYSAQGAFRDAAAGQGPLWGSGATQGLKDKATLDAQKALGGINTGLSKANAIGGARGQLLKAENQRQLAHTYADLDYKDLASRRAGSLAGAEGTIKTGGELQNQFGAGANLTEGVGASIQQQKQNEGDAQYQGLQRLAGLLSSSAVGAQSASETVGKTK